MTSNQQDRVNIRQFTKHQKHFPWKLIIKLLIGIGLIYFTYSIANLVPNNKSKEEKNLQEIEVDVSVD